MKLDEAIHSVKQGFKKINEAYGRTVFDEWAIISLQSIQGTIYDYSGPRHSDFQKNFLENLIPLRAEIDNDELEPGEFAFSREAPGTNFDAFIVLGDNLFLLCNHTEKTMEEITRDPRWKKAQQPFVMLCEKFRNNPLRT